MQDDFCPMRCTVSLVLEQFTGVKWIDKYVEQNDGRKGGGQEAESHKKDSKRLEGLTGGKLKA